MTSSKPQDWLSTFYQNLQSLADTAFPKTCTKCGKVYANSKAFLLETQPVRDLTLTERSGLFSLEGASDQAAIGVFRNCSCGTTLMADFHDRRDLSDKGAARRQKFDELMTMLQDKGFTESDARQELRHLLRGEASDKLNQLIGEIKLG